MCRYATPYKQHYTCFSCRKTFKRRLLVDIDRDMAYGKTKDTIPAKCPECGNLMANMGLDFESPKKKDEKAWSHMKNLYTSGVTYHSCGCTGPGYIPKDKEALIQFLINKQNDFIKQKKFWLSKASPESKSEQLKDYNKNFNFYYRIPRVLRKGKKKRLVEKEEAIKYWEEKIVDIGLKIERLKSY